MYDRLLDFVFMEPVASTLNDKMEGKMNDCWNRILPVGYVQNSWEVSLLFGVIEYEDGLERNRREKDIHRFKHDISSYYDY